ncbi:hypothetical protein MTR_2g033290 [Medicago truncatula]|uniref:Uncharacterized protein n=1 Tax=Medicago truncatula TaxID=3880 RepID=G7IL42_MEDTR|nr:hypothetical protein MTR_2g033290 [Medicago truncatula]
MTSKDWTSDVHLWEREAAYLFGGGRNSNPRSCIYYALSLSTELSLRGRKQPI